MDETAELSSSFATFRQLDVTEDETSGGSPSGAFAGKATAAAAGRRASSASCGPQGRQGALQVPQQTSLTHPAASAMSLRDRRRKTLSEMFSPTSVALVEHSLLASEGESPAATTKSNKALRQRRRRRRPRHCVGCDQDAHEAGADVTSESHVSRLVGRLSTDEVAQVTAAIAAAGDDTSLSQTIAVNVFLARVGLPAMDSDELSEILACLEPPFEMELAEQPGAHPRPHLTNDQFLQLVAILKEEHRAVRMGVASQRLETMRSGGAAPFPCDGCGDGALSRAELLTLFTALGGHGNESGHVASSAVSTFLVESILDNQSVAADAAPERVECKAAGVESFAQPRASVDTTKFEACMAEALAVARARTRNSVSLDFKGFSLFVHSFRELLSSFNPTLYADVTLDTTIEEDIAAPPATRARTKAAAAAAVASRLLDSSSRSPQRFQRTTFRDVARALAATLRARAQITHLHSDIVDRAMIKRVMDRHRAKLKRAMTPQVATALSFDAKRAVDVLLPSGELVPAGRRMTKQRTMRLGAPPASVAREHQRQAADLDELHAKVEEMVEARQRSRQEALKSVARVRRAVPGMAVRTRDGGGSPPRVDLFPSEISVRDREEDAFIREVAYCARHWPEQNERCHARRRFAGHASRVRALKTQVDRRELQGSMAPTALATAPTPGRRNIDDSVSGGTAVHVTLLCPGAAPPLPLALPCSYLTSLPKLLLFLQDPVLQHLRRSRSHHHHKSAQHHPTRDDIMDVVDVFFEPPDQIGCALPVSDPREDITEGVRIFAKLRHQQHHGRSLASAS